MDGQRILGEVRPVRLVWNEAHSRRVDWETYARIIIIVILNLGIHVRYRSVLA